MSSCWRPRPACGSGRPPDLAGSPLASAMVGEAARPGLDTARGLGWVATLAGWSRLVRRNETRISHLKRGFGLRRTRLRRLPGAQTWVGLGVFAYNLQRMTVVAAG